MSYIITGVVCLFIGWNVPQPSWAVKATNWLKAKGKEFFDEEQDSTND